MKCFNHEEIDAVGICKYCQKGFCHNCIVETPYGITCQGRCESEITELYAMIQQSKQDRITTSRTYVQTSLWLVILGFLFLVVSPFVHGVISIFLALSGLAFLLGAGFNYWSGRKYKSR